MALPIEYNIAIEEEERSVVVDWGNLPGWADVLKERLDQAVRISLIPKNGDVNLPVVSVALGDNRRWVVFSRVCGQVTSGKEIRLYAIGWQQTVRGVNVKSLQWIYPGGTVECAEDPSFVHKFFEGT